MRIVIATTTGFHLRRLAVELASIGDEIQYFSYVPRFRLRRDGLDYAWAHSAFGRLLPNSALALMTGSRWQVPAVERMLVKTDTYVTSHLPPSDVFIGLSAMAVRSAARARELGATVVIERGSRHVLSQDSLISSDGASGLSQRYIERELASYEQADFIAVPSHHAAQSFVDHDFPRERIVVCPLGVDLDRFAPTPRPTGSARLLFVGGWSHQKGVDLLVEACKARPEWRLSHVGTMAGAPFPHDDPQFEAHGPRTHAELARIMADHHVLVLPSRQDGFGMVLLEALASGLPVVASDMTGGPDIRETLTDPTCVEIVQAGDAQDLLRGVDAMLQREQRAASSRERVCLGELDRAHFSWRGYGQRYSAMLRQIVPAAREGS